MLYSDVGEEGEEVQHNIQKHRSGKEATEMFPLCPSRGHVCVNRD